MKREEINSEKAKELEQTASEHYRRAQQYTDSKKSQQEYARAADDIAKAATIYERLDDKNKEKYCKTQLKMYGKYIDWNELPRIKPRTVHLLREKEEKGLARIIKKLLPSILIIAGILLISTTITGNIINKNPLTPNILGTLFLLMGIIGLFIQKYI